jgi:hypothetical protein
MKSLKNINKTICKRKKKEATKKNKIKISEKNNLGG